MIYQFQYVTLNWRPPKLSASEEIEMGKAVFSLGKAHFRKEFRKKVKNTQSPKQINAAARFRDRPVWLKAILVIFSISLMIFAFVAVPVTLLLTILILFVYLTSFVWCLIQHDRWLSSCLSAYVRYKESTKVIIRCPCCAQMLRIPEGYGNIRVKCPPCGNRFHRCT